jgi:hypothetical protein
MRVDRHLSGPIRFTGIPDQASNRCSQACDSAPAVSRATRRKPLLSAQNGISNEKRARVR